MNRAILLLVALTVGSVASFGQGMMGGGPSGGRPGWGMMGGGGWWDYAPPPGAKQLSLDQVVENVQNYLKAAWGPDLELAEVMEFDNQFYAATKEKSTGAYAFELLINRWTGAIAPEPGPNMMWNAKYGMMGGGMMGGGMMGGWGWNGWGSYRGGPMPVTSEKAHELAQQALDAQLPGVQAEEEADAFYGYYTMDVMRDGKIYGMLSVNGFTGWVWYHTWHGKFIQERSAP